MRWKKIESVRRHRFRTAGISIEDRGLLHHRPQPSADDRPPPVAFERQMIENGKHQRFCRGPLWPGTVSTLFGDGQPVAALH
ncbi:hypothetical protein [Nonomuraea candida]|uniref:hypothetical protein n=1 Tax=Nonomuraea candida TaxID=359159 RepID=UPI0012F98DF6|nr:hypothetical protein [Nonomuraea candida]